MAIPIKDTPVLKGDDAKKFQAQIEESRNMAIPQSELQIMEANYDIFKNLEAKSKLK